MKPKELSTEISNTITNRSLYKIDYRQTDCILIRQIIVWHGAENTLTNFSIYFRFSHSHPTNVRTHANEIEPYILHPTPNYFILTSVVFGRK